MTEGESLRERAERIRTQLFEPGTGLGELSALERNQLKAERVADLMTETKFLLQRYVMLVIQE